MTTVGLSAHSAARQAFRLRPAVLGGSLILLFASAVLAAVIGPANISASSVILELLDSLPLISVDSGLDERQAIILWQWRIPRVLLGGIVGSSLAMSGAGYQGVFRNPLASPFLLGVAAGAGLGAVIAIVYGLEVGFGPVDSVAAMAFVGSMVAIMASTAVGRSAGRSTAILLLAGIAVASFLTAMQTFLLQRNTENLRQVYAWIFGHLQTSGWADVFLLAPYAAVCGTVLFLHRRQLDVLRLGEEEAEGLGINIVRLRWTVLICCSLLTAASVAVSGIIAFVGLVVPHMVRLVVGSSYRLVVPLSAIIGAAFLIFADVLARTIASPAELPIGVVTAFVGAPFFALILYTSRRDLI
jgi:iron complex transport system permease protein